LKKFLYMNSFYTLEEYFDQSWHASNIPHYIGINFKARFLYTISVSLGYLLRTNPISL
jgi:hypothetical protein